MWKLDQLGLSKNHLDVSGSVCYTFITLRKGNEALSKVFCFMDSKTQVKAALDILIEVGKVIKDATENSPIKGIPAGHLYGNLMGTMSLEVFEKIISVLVGAKVVRREDSHLLVWVGPK